MVTKSSQGGGRGGEGLGPTDLDQHQEARHVVGEDDEEPVLLVRGLEGAVGQREGA